MDRQGELGYKGEVQYGGRFLESAANFANGLRLLDAYDPWFTQTKATLEAVGRNYQEGMSKTILNASQPYFHPTALRGMEKFIFEEIASNPAFDLAETDPEKLFGMENNAATGFFGRGLGSSFSQTVANIPPAKRGAFYAAVQTAFPLLSDAATARMPAWQRLEQGVEDISPLDRGIVIARIMRNLENIQTLFATGKLTARNLVRLVTRNRGAQAKAAMASETAESIRGWRDFDFGDAGIAPFADAAKDHADFIIRDHMRPGNAGKFADNIHSTLLADADRAIYILNGTTYDHKPAGELVPAFKALVPDPRKQKAISTWINQLCMNTIVSPSNHVPYPTGAAAHELPGFGALVNRSLLTGTFENPVLETVGHGIVHDMKLSPDGRTATITQTISVDLAAPGSNMQRKIGFGQATFTQRLVIDLEPEIPTVTGYQLSQTIA